MQCDDRLDCPERVVCRLQRVTQCERARRLRAWPLDAPRSAARYGLVAPRGDEDVAVCAVHDGEHDLRHRTLEPNRLERKLDDLPSEMTNHRREQDRAQSHEPLGGLSGHVARRTHAYGLIRKTTRRGI